MADNPLLSTKPFDLEAMNPEIKALDAPETPQAYDQRVFRQNTQLIDSIPAPEEGPSVLRDVRDTLHSFNRMFYNLDKPKGLDPVDVLKSVSSIAGGQMMRAPENAVGVFGSKLVGNVTNAAQQGWRDNFLKLKDHAMQMRLEGKSNPEILRKTGLSRSTEGFWMYETDDSVMELKDFGKGIPGIAKKLPEAIDHPDLFKVFPHLENYKVRFDNTRKFETGYHDPFTEEINIGIKDMPAGSEKRLKQVLLHEIQHSVDAKEKKLGFGKASGSNLSAAKQLYEKFTSLLEDLDLGIKISPKEKELVDKVQANLTHWLKSGNAAGDDETSVIFRLYESDVGEARANATLNRMDLTAQERRLVSPESSEPLPRELQLETGRLLKSK